MTDRPRYSARLPLAVGFSAIALLLGGVGLWSVRTEIAGAVIAGGMIVVENNRQIVQHGEGGIVGEIHARDGDRIAKGDLLIRLDGTLLRSDLAIADLQLLELRARQARLEAERNGDDRLVIPDDLAASPDAARQIDGQRTFFTARRDTLAKALNQIEEQIRQTFDQIDGTEAQIDALTRQRDLIAAELADQATLLEKGLVQASRVSALRREAARLDGEIGRLTAESARLKGQAAAFEIDKLKLVSDRTEAAIAELRDLRVRELELTEERRRLSERLARLEIRAPVAGIVYGATVFAERAVIQPAEPLMYIVPQDQPLIVSARVEAVHIDQVHVGQAALLRFTAFDQRQTPEIGGDVIAVSADVIHDERTGLNFYRVDLLPSAEDLIALDRTALMPGMPVEAYLRTDTRTPLSYLTKPLTDYFNRAMREG